MAVDSKLDGPRLAPWSGPARQLVVFVHGYGADGNDLIEIGRAWQALLPQVSSFQELAYGLARVDVLAALAKLAQERRYCRPSVVEERVLELQQTKRELADAIIGAENSVLRGLTREHLELLLS